MTSSSRIAFLDADGTILDHDGTVAPATVAAIRTARARGHLVFLCTGRAGSDIHPRVQEIGFDGVISNSGAFARVGDELVVARTMSAELLARLRRYFDERGMMFFVQADDGVYATAQVRELIAGLRNRPEAAEVAVVSPRFLDIAGLDDGKVVKAVFMSPDALALTRAQAELGDAFHVVPGSFALPGGSNGEISPAGVTKGSAIEAVLAHLGRDASETIGIGDSWNDAEMFQVCGVSIAMGNADPALKKLADEVTTSVSEGGVAHAFARHGLI